MIVREPAAYIGTSFVHAKQQSLVVNLRFHTIADADYADVILTEAADTDDTDDASVTKLKLRMLMLVLLLLMLMLLILMMLV